MEDKIPYFACLKRECHSIILFEIKFPPITNLAHICFSSFGFLFSHLSENFLNTLRALKYLLALTS